MCLPLKPPTRQDRLRAFLAQHGLNQRKVAIRLGISEAYLGQIFAGKRRPEHYINKLVDMGIPSELLPDKSK
jgi:predicted transcriptional regulator